jgi:ADP-ribose pyrophosphatase YjhB (NUDIX family)
MHWIQQHILLELTRTSKSRYSELRPSGVEGNLFLYHLEGLVKGGFVQKADGAYSLTAQGKAHVATLSLETGKQRQQPLVLTAVVLRNEAGEYLLYRWKREPNTGLVSLPHGLVHVGETLEDMAALELAEKADLKADLKYLGLASIIVRNDDDIERHWHVHVYVGANSRPLNAGNIRPEVGEAFWGALSDQKAEDFLPGFYELLALINDDQFHDIVNITLP